MNEHDSERIAGLLESRGYRSAPTPEEADLVVLQTCAIRESADNRLYGALGALKRSKTERPQLRIAVGGCLAQKDGQGVLERAPWVDAAFGTFAVAELPGLLDRRERTGAAASDFRERAEVYPSALPARRARPFQAWVAVSVGCDNACTFCIVPRVRGGQVSRPMDDILSEIRALVADGVVEVCLLGQNVNTYGRDREGRPMFAGLLRSLDGIEGLRRARFTSPHPHDFTADVMEAMAGSAVVCEHIHFPLQSGSDPVLRRMRRSYGAGRYMGLLGRIREAVPGIAVSTDVIVGFPGETEEDFGRTLGVVEEARFDSAFTFRYSVREGTPAATMPDQVPAEVVAERFARLVDLQERISLERNREMVGRSVEVLIEGPSKKDPRRVAGRTRTNKLVHLTAGGSPAGRLVEVVVTGAHPHHLDGRPGGRIG
ncbi:MAG: tRNA (N6-isopentenyl adenosine(37)-C2)-methylthiotransferase MiaB [Acidobacteria bacterium]|nr:tRNA (N6-isopentenyl adenosine(37)-C2)-methylthiotransferase MiaB [Acidobacteriota bacterium]